MLTVAKVTAGQAQGYADYLEGKTQKAELGDYYLKDGSGSRHRDGGSAAPRRSAATPAGRSQASSCAR